MGIYGILSLVFGSVLSLVLLCKAGYICISLAEDLSLNDA